MYIRKGQMLAHVTDQGGSVTFWAYGEHTLLGPVRQVQTADGLRLRGDSHWCFPMLGKPPAGEQFQSWPMHGQMRHLGMKLCRSDQDAVSYSGELRLGRQPGWICDLRTINRLTQEYEDIEPNMLEVRLGIKNISQPTVPRMPVLPALHSYLNVAGGAVLKIGGRAIDFGIGAFGPLVVRREVPIVLERAIGRVTICPSSNCESVVIWTDQASLYLGVELVFGGAPGSFNTPEGHTIGTLVNMYCTVAFQFVPA